MRLPNALRFVRAPVEFLRAAWRVWNAASTAQQSISLVATLGIAGAFYGIFTGLPPGWRFLLVVFLVLIGALAVSLGLEEGRARWLRYRNRELGFRCIRLANEMNFYLSDRRQQEPDTSLVYSQPSPTEEERHRQWNVGAHYARHHRTATAAGFETRFRVRFAGIAQQLILRGHMSEDERRHHLWSIEVGEWLPQIPDALAAKGYELTGGQEPPE